jgi:hypothetical protein
LSAIPSTPYRAAVASEQRDVKAVFLVAFLVILTCVQGIRVSNVPVPFALLFSIFYITLFRPPIPAAAPRIYAIVLSYLLIVSTRNALSDTGSIRDFLYIGICLTNIAVTIALFDLFQAVETRTIGTALLFIALFEITLQMLEYLDVGGFNRTLAPALRFWAAQSNSESFNAALLVRAPGTFGAPTGAGLALYLVIRAAAIVLHRRRLIYLSIIPIFIAGARSALIIFVLWEVVAQLVFHWRRNLALAMTGLFILFAGLMALMVFPRFATRFFLFSSFNVSSTQFAEGFSVVNRVRSVEWAFQHWQQFVTFGGITGAELANRISWQGSGVDSELILRSLQFGFVGFLCLVVSNVWIGFFHKNPDSWFVLFFVVVASLTNSMLSEFVLFPFVIIYCLCINITKFEPPRETNAAT